MSETTDTKLPATGYIRLPRILNYLSVSQSSWYAGVKAGIYPRPVKIGLRAAAYRAKDVQRLIDRIEAGEKPAPGWFND